MIDLNIHEGKEMSEAKHNPTPWAVVEDESLCEYDVFDATGNLLFSVGYTTDDADNIDEETDATVAFLMTAVNSHAALLAALKTMSGLWYAYVPADHYDGHAAQAQRDAIAAIKLAEGDLDK